ncbi:Uma2 family endonuclease [Capilliphycus salinus ALCB114379]|uniref:Uma2 family endonuclease n=1 Tax=Capilliphycus salinus TaxID=2768948 RepID=UPI0039A47B4C
MFSQETVNTNITEEKNVPLMTLDEFLDWYPDGYYGRFELHNGVVIQVQPTGTHEQVAGFLASKLSVYIERLNLPFFIPRQGLIKAIDSDKSAYIPDVMVLDYNALENESLWKKRSTITQGKSIKLAVEVVSTNWQDDYLMKLGEYEKLGIGEYWIVDYLGLGGRRYIGNPKQPTILVYHLVEGEYTVNLFRGEDVVGSPTFPELNLTVQQIFAVGQ